MYFAVSSAVPIHQKPIDILSCDSFDVEELSNRLGMEWPFGRRAYVITYGYNAFGILRLIPACALLYIRNRAKP